MESKRIKFRNSPSLSRRDFVQQSLGLGLLGLTAGCSSLDRLIMGDFRDGNDKVVILGAGLAGLMTAYKLRKAGVPFQIFEASSRLGGRVHTVPEFLRGQPNAELGGEWISVRHQTLLDLAKELKVELIEFKEGQSPKFKKGGRFSGLRSLQKDLTRLQAAAAKSKIADEASLASWFKSLTQDSFFQSLVNDWSLERFGISAPQVSAFSFSDSWIKSGTSALAPWTDHRLRVRNGSSALVQGLFDRISGYQPDSVFRMKHRLRSIRYRNQIFELSFETESGQNTVYAKTVVCALPRPVLSSIDGLSEVGGDQLNQMGVGTGYHSKFLFGFSERFWTANLDQSKALQFASGQSVWESSYRLNPLFQFRQGILTVNWGGEGSKNANLQTLEALRKELLLTFKAQGTAGFLDSSMANWEKASLFQGSVSFPQVGRALQPLGSDGGLSHTVEAPQGWVWAGEHTVAEPGSMDAALRSGIQACEQILRQNPVLSGKSQA